MLTETFRSISAAVRKLLKSWPSMVLLAIVYAALLGALYFFMAIREASIPQVVLTFALAIAAFILFFLLQTMVVKGIVRGNKDGVEGEPGVLNLVKSSAANCWKLIIIALPLVAVAILIAYLLNKAQNYFGPGAADADVLEPLARPGSRAAAQAPIDWRVAIFSSLRYLSFGLFLPLATIHLWLAAMRDGLGPSVRRLGTNLARAFAPSSVLIYIIGFLIFGVLPCFLLFKTTPNSRAWLEISFLVARLTAVFLLTLFGWVITVWALSFSSSTTSPSPTTASSAEPARKAA